MYKVERAIILAAGKGSRLKPITDSIPKPLIEVNGTSMIESIIKALHKNKIYEIYIVVGYLKEKFEILKNKYKSIKFIYNPYFETCNNISSLYVVREYLENAIIMDGDQIIYNFKILDPYFEKSGYSCVWSSEYTSEWLLTLDDKQNIINCNINGGSNAWRLFSVSRWNSEDGKRLKSHLEEEFINKNNTSIYWDNVALILHLEDYCLGINKIDSKDIAEIDSLEELYKIDKNYVKEYGDIK